jgi:hypothetical protein
MMPPNMKHDHKDFEMDHSERVISSIEKVRLHLKAVPRLGNEKLASTESEAEFIYGIGSDGVSAFEKVLFGRKPGDQFALPVECGAECSCFGHLNLTVLHAVGMKPPYVLHVTILSVEPASDQEVIRAMAQAGGCGGGCDCGCGG